MHGATESAYEQFTHGKDHRYDEGHAPGYSPVVSSLWPPPGGSLEATYHRQVAHDIRHGLTTIQIVAGLLTDSSDIGPESRDRLRTLRDETAWLQELVSVYEPQPGRARPLDGRPAELPITRLDELVDAIARPARIVSGIDVLVEAAVVRVRAHPLSLWRILRNLVGNAVTAAGPDGQVSIRLSLTGNFARLEIEDDGPGINALTALRLKDPNRYGLKIVAQLLDDCNGTIGFCEGSRGGCLARLRIPAVVEDAAG